MNKRVSGANDTDHYPAEDEAKQAFLKAFAEKDKRIAELEALVENMKRESKLLENILNYVWSVPIRQRCAIWNDINKVCSDCQSDNLKKEERG
jgi:hypothetical protein